VTGATRLEVGRIGRAHGLRGELSVTLTSDRSERLTPGAVLGTGERELVVRSSRPHQQRWLVCFEGIDDRTQAEQLQGAALFADALPSEGDELWVHELVGATVRDEAGNALGTVEAIEANPASDLLVLDGERLVPLRFVVAHEPGVVTVDLPDGLWD
jgi:16S rRNA processing protein RimM